VSFHTKGLFTTFLSEEQFVIDQRFHRIDKRAHKNDRAWHVFTVGERVLVSKAFWNTKAGGLTGDDYARIPTWFGPWRVVAVKSDGYPNPDPVQHVW
jgi:hypothetical protein